MDSRAGDEAAVLVRDAEDDAPEATVRGLRFDDPYWDDAFCAWWDPALRTCC